jgi:DNA repair protein SbcD/Mre11
MIRIAHFSDLHYSEKNLAEADRCFGFAVDEAIRRGAQVAVISGDATDHALDMHSPAVQCLARHVRRLADHCLVLMLQGTYSHEPPGTLSILRLLGGRYPVHVADRIEQVALLDDGRWRPSAGWRFEQLPIHAAALLSCVPTVNKATVAAAVGATEAATAIGQELSALLAGFALINQAAREAGIPTIGVSHGTVAGCITEHGVPMAGFDHEFSSGALFAAQAQAFLLGHIHRHQVWEHDGRFVAYAGSIGRFHHGEIGDKGSLMWEVGASTVALERVATPARRTVDLVFEGRPDPAAIAKAPEEQQLDGAHVRVRWTIADENRHGIDRAAIRQALAGAADVQLEGRVIPVVRSRSEGISRCSTLAGKVAAWCAVTSIESEPLLERVALLAHEDPSAIAASVLSRVACSGASCPGSTGDRVAPMKGSTAATGSCAAPDTLAVPTFSEPTLCRS